MSSFYVYSPVTGTITTQWVSAAVCSTRSQYCGGGCHPTVYGLNPVDLSTGWGTRLDFWSSPIVGSSTWAVLSIRPARFPAYAEVACQHLGIPAW